MSEAAATAAATAVTATKPKTARVAKSEKPAKPATTTLQEWVARWPKQKTYGFDPETREATVYTDAGRATVVRSIAWKREADTLTILSQPTRFSAPAVTAATSRAGKVREERAAAKAAGDEQLRLAETSLLDAWRSYNAAQPANRGTLVRDILTAEAAIADLEKERAPKDRFITTNGEYTYTYVPPMPFSRRGVSLVEEA
jgi:hypothetical protein